ncbi:putative uncharacterized protein FLJ37770 [Zootermopsis nevadensis]|uniref:putative uncharacterized protein FLJ37770 n=1 Tax=Zootermopsis nevadensis TaxID=136037 RepID=UPI000B8E7FBE|nr:putative uncharacterized protein FLJ37770 [Zootermopsis nevadensis]
MTERLEQRCCIKFCQKLGVTQVETFRKIQQAFGDDAMSITRIKEWCNRFQDGRTSVESEPRSISRNDEVIDQVWTLVMLDRRVTVRELADEVTRLLRDAVRRKRPDLWAAGTWQLHQSTRPFFASVQAF